MNQPNLPPILVAALGRHQVTMTNPRIGTVLVSRRGFRMFRDLIADRGILGKKDTQSDFLCELSECFEAAICRGRDSQGNLMLHDRDMEILFIVAREEHVLLRTYYKKRNGKSRGQIAKRRVAAAKKSGATTTCTPS